MAEHRATIRWQFTDGDFKAGRYSREHTWSFDGGAVVPASSSPSIVRLPYSNPAGVDPEEAFVAAIASCHMLSFLYEAQRAGLGVLTYVDEAVGVLTKNEQRVAWISSVVLDPQITFEGTPPPPEKIRELHAAAHHACFIANSVKTDIVVKGG